MTDWVERIDLSDALVNYDLPFERRRDLVVTTVRGSRWFARYAFHGSPALADLIDLLAATATADEFGAVLEQLYDLADADRVGLGPLGERI